MDLVVDTNIIFSFFRENPVRTIIIESESYGLRLFSPAHLIDELKDNIPELVKYSKKSPSEVESIIDELKMHVLIVPSLQYLEFKDKARPLAPHKSDKDLPYFALALKLDCPIWSNEPGFKEQTKVGILNTEDLKDKLGISDAKE
jgi:predicted nucleic acid-binding protein